ncbi:MAG: cardiolipin synthase [Pseudomonadota bacterium]
MRLSSVKMFDILHDILQERGTLIFAVAYLSLEFAAVVAAVHAVMHVRTAQGATAWLIALLTAPFIALPLYAVFGRRRFLGYVAARRAGDAAIADVGSQFKRQTGSALEAAIDRSNRRYAGFETVAGTPFLAGNRSELLVDGVATFEAIFNALGNAEDYVLVQFYIIRADKLGERLREALIACRKRGVRVYLLYDAVGSYGLPRRWLQPLIDAGADVSAFTGTTRRTRRLQVNFRNHRKLVVVDGQSAFVGGHNVGDEYLNEHPVLSPWRDTHVAVRGPVATATQVPFIQDWYWSTGTLPIVSWHPRQLPAGEDVLSLPSGPADELEAGSLMFVHAIHSARGRLWIVSPYFVPNGSIIDALKLAAYRGVDVRILIPGITDNRIVALAGRAYLPELIPSGVRVFRYQAGFLHQKVMLIDDDLAAVGTANLDNRSMRLNFEHTLIFADAAMAARMEAMLEADFAASEELEALEADPWWLRAASRGARLFAPVL